MTELPDLSCLTHEEKDALIRALWTQVQALTAQVQTLAARVAELEAKLGGPPKTPDNSSLRRCCMGRRDGRVEPSPDRGSCDADGVRAPQLQHAVEDMDSDVYLGRPALVRVRA